MTRKIYKGGIKKLLTVLIVLTLIISCSANAFAATGIYFGSGTVSSWPDINFEVRGYFYYNSNTSAALDIYSMAQWVYNYGNAAVNQQYWFATDEGGTKPTGQVAGINPITYGNNRRVELPWSSLVSNTSYPKNGTNKAVMTDMSSTTQFVGGGWGCNWFQSSYSPYFH